MNVVQIGERRKFASKPERGWEEARLRAKMTAVTLASEALAETLEANLAAVKLISRLLEQPTPASSHLVHVIHGQLHKSLAGLDSLLEGLESL